MTPVLRPFKPEDLLAFANRDGAQGANLELAIIQATAGPAFTAVIGDEILGAAGVVIPWAGVGCAWMRLSEQLNGHGLWLTKTVKAGLAEISQARNLHRLEAVVLSDSRRNQAWLEALGFSLERDGRARAFTADRRDALRYELIGS